MKKLKQCSAYIWCGLFLISVVGFAVERWQLAKSMENGWRFLVIDDTTFFYPRKMVFEEAYDFHFDQAQLACESLLNRNLGKVDSISRLKSLYRSEAYKEATEIIEREVPLFLERSMYQKVSIEERSLMKIDRENALVLISGQLIRSGLFSGSPFVEVLNFEFKCHLQLNHSMIENGRYPTVVYNFTLTTTPASIR